MEGSDHRWRGAIAGGVKRSGGERSRVEGSSLSRWGGAIAGGGQVEGSDNRLRSNLRWTGAISGGGEQLQSRVEGSGQRWRGAISGGGERSQVEPLRY